MTPFLVTSLVHISQHQWRNKIILSLKNTFFTKSFFVASIIKGFLDSCHYNSPTLEEYHYFSRYLKLAIKILQT